MIDCNLFLIYWLTTTIEVDQESLRGYFFFCFFQD